MTRRRHNSRNKGLFPAWKCLVALCLPFCPDPSFAADRITVIVPPANQEAAEELVDSLASACNRGDFVGFMDHFTPTHANRIRRRMEDVFIKRDPQMDIQKVTLLSDSDDRITFGVRYSWHEKDRPEQIVASKIAAKKMNGKWRLDNETVTSVDRMVADSNLPDKPGSDAVPAAWNAFDPPAARINPALEHLRGDIGIRPGLGCVNGRCGR
jgi:hypothetical protein